MESIFNEYEPSDEFIVKMGKMSLSDFSADYCMDIEDKKSIRNNYDNRMRKRNLIFYYMDHCIVLAQKCLNVKKTRTIGTQTKLGGLGNRNL